MDKIMIVTLWDSNNYGAYLQSFALGKVCSDLRYDVYYLEDTKENHRLVNQISKKIRKSKYQIELYKNFKKEKNKFRLISRNTLVQCVILGADEIWNTNNNFFNHDDYFLGYNFRAERIIAYAPSCNGVNEGSFKKTYKNKNFEMIDFISVRDQTTSDLVCNIQGMRPFVALDPTFLIEDYEPYIIKPDLSNYVFIYGYSFSEVEKKFIINFAKEKNLRIISAGAYLDWTDLQMPVGPFDFLGLIKSADYVFTSTFHGTVFSIIFNKCFYTFARNNNKVLEILDLFNLSNRNISNQLFHDFALEFIDYHDVNMKILKLRNESMKFLLSSLNHSKKGSI